MYNNQQKDRTANIAKHTAIAQNHTRRYRMIADQVRAPGWLSGCEAFRGFCSIPEDLQFFRDLPDQKFQETLQPQTQRRIPMREPRSTCSSLFRPFPEKGRRPPKN